MEKVLIIKTKKKTSEDMCVHILAVMLNFPMLYEIYDILYKNGVCNLNYLPQISSIYINIILVCISILLIVKRRDCFWLIIWGISYAILLLISCFIYKDLLRYVPRAVIYFLCCVLCIAGLFRQISDASKLLYTLEKYIPISLAYAILKYIFFDASIIYDMGYTYHIVIPVLTILVTLLYRKKSIFKYLSLCFLLFVNFKYGSRGCYVYCFVAVLLIYFTLSSQRKLLTFLTIIIIIFSISLGWSDLINYLIIKFPNSRNVRLLANGMIFYSAGRENIYHILLEEIFYNPLHFRGIFSDRFLVAKYYGKLSTDDIWGCYAHNILIEMIYQYSIMIIPFIIGYSRKIVITYKNICCKLIGDADKKMIFIIFVSYAIAQLSISSSYLIATSFGGLVGVIYMCNRKLSVRK